MRKSIYGVIAVTILLLSMTTQTQAGCPPGYNASTITATYNYGATYSCSVTIEVCCKLDAANNRIDIQIGNIYGTYNNCIAYIPDWVDFLKWAHKMALRQGYRSCSPQFFPCDNPYYQQYKFYVHSYRCMKYVNEVLPGDEIRLSLIPCDELNKCWSWWKVCTDYSKNPPEDQFEFVLGGSLGNPQCSTVTPQLPPPDDPIWLQPFETYCFTNPCPY